MSPLPTLPPASAAKAPFPDVGLQIVGVAPGYPKRHVPQDTGLREYANTFYPKTPAMEKVLDIASKTGIIQRACAVTDDDPTMYNKVSPTIDLQRELFHAVGVDLAVGAARKVIAEWGGELSQITHIIAVSSMVFSNPGVDFRVAQALGLSNDVERVVLHGVGCSGGLAGVRHAANIACGYKLMNRPARILIVAVELGTVSLRTELDKIHRTQQVLIPATLFADAASALMLSNGIGQDPKPSAPVYDLLAWDLTTVDDSAGDIAFDADVDGWSATLTHRVPKLTSTSVPSVFASITSRVAAFTSLGSPAAADFDWAIHPGGAKVLVDVCKVMGLTEEHCRASWDIYRNHGNTSSATIFSVLNRLRQEDMGVGRDFVLATAFGPGVSVETCVLKRCRKSEAEVEA
ncbi:thiolase-like protein [Cytidiella melzeri]|nr:thiolase-like protein [Cytidiella melzeri]